MNQKLKVPDTLRDLDNLQEFIIAFDRFEVELQQERGEIPLPKTGLIYSAAELLVLLIIILAGLAAATLL